MNPFDYFFFVIFPYLVMGIFLVGTIYRYQKSSYTITSLSAQFLEGRRGFWGTVPFHWGILMIFLGHMVAFLFPASVLAWNADPVRLMLHEGLGFTFAIAVLVGLCALILRRLTNPRLQVVTSKMDLFVEFMLLVQVILGCWIALGYRWGSSWFAADLSPYLWSISKVQSATGCRLRNAAGDQSTHRRRLFNFPYLPVHAPGAFVSGSAAYSRSQAY